MQSSGRALRIGTRGSPLALAQAGMVRDRLAAAHGLAPERIEIHDDPDHRRYDPRPPARPSSAARGCSPRRSRKRWRPATVDIAVHSAKDMPTVLPDGLIIAAVLPREDPRDVFISRKAKALRELPAGAVVGTASLRRQALVKRLRPDLAVVPFRGNVETRLRKLDDGAVDATLLALAGLKRLGLAEAATETLTADEFIPAVGQGIIAIEARENDAATRDAAGGDRSCRQHDGAGRRARVPRRARRLLPHADRRPCGHRRRPRCASAA